MTAPLPPQNARHARHAAPALPAAVPAPPTAPRRGMRLGVAGLLLGLGAVLMAATAAYGAVLALGGRSSPWVAALGAAFGVALAGVPLGWLMFKLAAELAPGGGREEAGQAPPAGMPRGLFMTLAEREFARARRYGTGAALLLVDLDRHARLCEARGPAAGVAVLAELLRQTAPTLRTADVLTQFTASQMAVFLVHADATGALDVAERIRERTEQMEVLFPEGPQGQRLRVTASAGVAHLRPAHLSLQALIDDAVDAVSAARATGGNCVRAAPVDHTATGLPGPWRDRRARPKQGGAS